MENESKYTRIRISSKLSSVPKCGFIDEDGGVAHTWHTERRGFSLRDSPYVT
jgi:hypothetical protein